ncbi:CGNR zinc finger domain-containing protein [Thioclava kandeliae]|uniref:CGNR zinc finger domain-containing protein n=1 Tax=Thioclava kandeliae TaxID=3070818 RepID=A0ABV1SIB8_9RHOB
MSKMLFGTDTQPSAEMAVALVNSLPERGGQEGLPDSESLLRMGRALQIFYQPDGSQAELLAMRNLRQRLNEIIRTPELQPRMDMLNELFFSASAIPQIVTHPEDPTPHFHYTLEDASYIDHIKAITTYALSRLIIIGEWGRLRTCEGHDCNRLFLDTTRNGKRLYCNSKTCGNRIHSARYRNRATS